MAQKKVKFETTVPKTNKSVKKFTFFHSEDKYLTLFVYVPVIASIIYHSKDKNDRIIRTLMLFMQIVVFLVFQYLICTQVYECLGTTLAWHCLAGLTMYHATLNNQWIARGFCIPLIILFTHHFLRYSGPTVKMNIIALFFGYILHFVVWSFYSVKIE